MKVIYTLILAFIFGTGFSQVNLNLGLRAYYPFSGNSLDASGNNNNPVFNNATLTADKFGNANSAYHFNGINTYIQIPNSVTLNTTNQISISALVKADGFYTGTCHGNSILMKGVNEYESGNYILRFDDGAYTSGGNCSNPVDSTHENFYGNSNSTTPYTPYIQPGVWYSVVYTYDGNTIKLYVNCNLVRTTTLSGMTFTNSYPLYIGRTPIPGFPYWLNGDLDEIRIYDRVLNTAEIDVLGSCAIIPPTVVSSTNINDYTPVLSLDICKNKITVEDGIKYNIGDTVLLIQMKGAIIDSTNTASFGNITDYKSAGNYEFNYVKSKAGNVIELKNKIIRTYEIPVGKVQLIRVPYFINHVVTDTLTCLPWDGSKGGVLVLNVRDTVILNNVIDVTGKGFRGGNSPNLFNTSLACSMNDYKYPSATINAAKKGESIYNIGFNNESGKGKNANGGGGGNGHNSGGGGGSNGGSGGFGGYQLINCGGSSTDNRGIGGSALTLSNAANKIFMGGGGGCGHTDNAGGINMKGGNGGGIVIISATEVINNNQKIIANGLTGELCNNATNNCHDGNGGGGGGGTNLLFVNNYTNNLLISHTGGKGADLVLFNGINANQVGPGGGGGGGLCWVKQNTTPASLTINTAGGLNGVILQNANDPWGATPGTGGSNLFNLVLPISTLPFKPNIDSVKIAFSSTSCNGFSFNGLAFTNTTPVVTWQWNFGDGATATGQNTVHTYATTNTFPVTLVVTDINGCKDSVVKNVSSNCQGINIINDYTPVLSLDICKNKITVEDGIKYNIGDTVLLIQMKGAIIDSTNTASFGNITDYKSAGNYEFNYVKSRAGNVIELKNKMIRTYEIPDGKVQLIRVPYFTNYVVTDTLTCLPWDGNKGGVLVLNVQNNLILNNPIDVSGRGFRGGVISNNPDGGCGNGSPDYYYPLTQTGGSWSSGGAEKGEGISKISASRSAGKGNLANGGGGGNKHNAGGGGGSNYAIGGRGGNELQGCTLLSSGGIGGLSLASAYANSKIFMGGGGGRGDDNNGVGTIGENGGGIIIMSCTNLNNNGFSLKANGKTKYTMD